MRSGRRSSAPSCSHGRGAPEDTRAVEGAEPVDEVHVVYTRFKSMLVQEPTTCGCCRSRSSRARRSPTRRGPPLYEFEPCPRGPGRPLLPRYVQSRIFFALLQAAASELAARQKAMKSATDNADEMIKKYTRIANQARQAGITRDQRDRRGVNALADANAGQDE